MSMSGFKSILFFLFLFIFMSSCEKDDGNEPPLYNDEETTTNIGETIIVGNSENMQPVPAGISISMSPEESAQTNIFDVDGDEVSDFKIISFWSVSPSHSQEYHTLYSLHENAAFLTVLNSRSVYLYHDTLFSFIRKVTSCTELSDTEDLSFINLIEQDYIDIAAVDSLQNISVIDANFAVDTMNIVGIYGNSYMSSGPAGYQSSYNLNCDPNLTFVGNRQYLVFRINNPEDDSYKLGWFKLEMPTESQIDISEAFIQQ